MYRILVSLIGHQWLPNYLVARHLEHDLHVLVYTEDTKGIVESFKSCPGLAHSESQALEVDAYSFSDLQEKLHELFLTQEKPGEVTMHLTGGTKMMGYSAFHWAQKDGLKACYLDTGKTCRLVRLTFDGEEQPIQSEEIVAECLTLDDYIHMAGFLPPPERMRPLQDGFRFEDRVARVLEDSGCEVKTGLRSAKANGIEIDILARRGNHVAVISCKHRTTKSLEKKKDLDQLAGAHKERIFGIFTKGYLVSNRDLDPDNIPTAELLKIKNICLKDYDKDAVISDADAAQIGSIILPPA